MKGGLCGEIMSEIRIKYEVGVVSCGFWGWGKERKLFGKGGVGLSLGVEVLWSKIMDNESWLVMVRVRKSYEMLRV